MSAPKSSVVPGPSAMRAKQKDHSTQRSPWRLSTAVGRQQALAALARQVGGDPEHVRSTAARALARTGLREASA